MVYGNLRRCITYRSTRRRCGANCGSLAWLGAGFRQAVRPQQENIISTITPFIKRYPVVTYFALVFTISWGGFVVVVGPPGFLGAKKTSEELLPVVYLATPAPTVAGMLLTALIDGRPGFRELRCRLLRWRVGFRSSPRYFPSP